VNGCKAKNSFDGGFDKIIWVERRELNETNQGLSESRLQF